MADYSGWHQCAECGARETYWRPAQHGPLCSVPAKIAQEKLEAERREQAKRDEDERTRQVWRDMPEDEFMEELHKLSLQAGDLYEMYVEYKKDYDLGIEVIHERRLINKWLDKAMRWSRE